MKHADATLQKPQSRITWRRLGFLTLIICVTAGPSFAQAATLIAPHRAIYDLTLLRAKGSVARVSGSMSYEWGDACDGWAVTQRAVINVRDNDGSETEIGWSLASWEAKDGLRYRFVLRRLQNGEITEELRGRAMLNGAGQGGLAQYDLPTANSVILPPGAVFPTQHALRLLESAAAGDRLYWSSVFDGTDIKGPTGVNAVIAKSLPVETLATAKFPMLAQIPSWRIALAFFGQGQTGELPQQEQSIRYYANGVADEVALDFTDFSVLGKISVLEPLEAPPC